MNAYVTVTDAAGRVLFRRPATSAEIEEARAVAHEADAEANASLARIAAERQTLPTMGDTTPPEFSASHDEAPPSFTNFAFEDSGESFELPEGGFEFPEHGFGFTEEDEGNARR